MSGERLRPGRVLIIDDEPNVADALRAALSLEHEATALTDAREALVEIVNGGRYDLILCDIVMEDMTGLEFLGALRSISGENARRVVLMSGSFQALAEAQGTGNICLLKPLDLDGLRELVSRSVPRPKRRSTSSTG